MEGRPSWELTSVRNAARLLKEHLANAKEYAMKKYL